MWPEWSMSAARERTVDSIVQSRLDPAEALLLLQDVIHELNDTHEMKFKMADLENFTKTLNRLIEECGQ